MTYGKRFSHLFFGQLLTAFGVVGMVQANIGLDPWNCLHQGMEYATGLSFGTCTILVGAIAVLIATLLHEPFGFGTVADVIVPGILIDLIQGLGVIPQMHSPVAGTLMMLAGQMLLSLGTYYYMSAAMGAGPRDSLMVAVSRLLHVIPGTCRSILELLAILFGWAMGAKVGFGTILSALTIGITLQLVFNLFHFDPRKIHHDNLAEMLHSLREKHRI